LFFVPETHHQNTKTPLSAMSDTNGAPKFVLWHYSPSVIAAAIAAALFGILTIANLVRLLQKKTWFCLPLVIGGLCKYQHVQSILMTDQNAVEIIGFSARAWAHYNQEKTMPYAIQSVLILLAPILFAASVYMFLGRIIRAARGEQYSIIPLKWLTKVFVIGDVLCFCVQGGGGGILTKAKSASDVNTGENVILGGLVLQILTFFIFIVTAAIWHKRMASYTSMSGSLMGLDWPKYLYSLYAVSCLILIRNIVRCAEYGGGSDGYLLSHEWTVYVFDALLMVFVLAISVMWYGDGITDDLTASHDEESGVDLAQ